MKTAKFLACAALVSTSVGARSAGSVDRVIPGHDALQFQKFPTQGRVAKLK
jgi:hypothetical protein